ncbi:MAG: hypothetical protein ACXWJZ_13550 [Burkholderiaceae bacterium]
MQREEKLEGDANLIAFEMRKICFFVKLFLNKEIFYIEFSNEK